MSPQRPNLVLASDIPNIELDVFIGDCLDVEADCGDCGYWLVKFELIEDGFFDNISLISVHDVDYLTYWSFPQHRVPA